MKKYLSIVSLLTLVLVGFSLSATQADAASIARASRATGNWSSASTWAASCGGSTTAAPLVTDTITICNGHTVTVDISTALVGTITIASGGTLIVTTGGTLNANNDITVSSGGILTISGGVATTTAGTQITVTGTMNLSSGTTTIGTNSGGSDTTIDGNLNISGGYFIAGHDFKGTGTTTMSAGTLTVGHDFKPTTPSKFVATGGTVDFIGSDGGAGAFPAGTYNFYNLTVESGITPGFSKHSTLINVANNLTSNTGQLDFLGILNTANALYFGSTQQAEGTWGSTGSSAADNKNNTYFLSTATGLVTVSVSGSGSHPRPRVPDTTAPVITILGNNPATTTVGSIYVDAGATAEDNINGTVTSLINSISDVDTTIAGTYFVSYVVTDTSGNTAVEVRTVYVLGTGSNATSTASTSTIVLVTPSGNEITVPVTFGTINAQIVHLTIIIKRQLRRGSRGNDVKQLQTLLTKDGTFLEGLLTGYFGLLTEKAVQKFQIKYGIAQKGTLGFGKVGPKTRAKLIALFEI